MKLLVVIDILLCLSIKWEGVKSEHAKRTEPCVVLGPGEEHVITSPNFPSSYDNNENFDACVQSRANGPLYYRVTHFENECNRDVLMINNNRQPCNQISPNCGVEVPVNALEVTFRTDGSVVHRGFSMKVWATEAETASNEPCVVLTPGEERVITSPNYPSNYDTCKNMLACVKVEGDAKLYYEVTDFETECDTDNLVINGNTQTCNEISSTDGGVRVRSQNLEVTFNSDGENVHRGFRMRVWATERCVVLGPGEEHIITSPNFPSSYNNNEHFDACVQSRANGLLYYRVTHFETECSPDVLTINNNRQPCNGISPNCGVEVPSKTLEVTFRTDGSAVHRGFSMKVWATEPETDSNEPCVVLTPGEERIITSPNYPSNYDTCRNMVACVKVEGDVKLYYEVTDFETQCDVDNLVINGNTHTCNEISPSVVPVPSQNLEVTFNTDGEVVNRGFRMRVWASGE